MISVIIPVKNGEKTIYNSISTVLSQGIEDIEVICVLNGCVDDTQKSIERINDSRVKITESSPGIVPALNQGLRISRGDLIARQDADDIWYENKLQKQLTFLKENPEVDILGCQMEIVDGSYNHIRNTNYPLQHDEIINNLLRAENSIGHPSVIFKKKILDRCAGYLDLFPLAEDMDLWIRSAAWYRMANLPDVLVRYTHVPNPKYNPQVPNTLSAWYRMIYGVK